MENSKTTFTIYIHKGDELVEFESLSEEEKDSIRLSVFEKLADGIMEPEGYRRVRTGTS